MTNIKQKAQVFRLKNAVMIVDGGVKKIINSVEMLKKSDNEILAAYNSRKSGEGNG